MRILVLDDDPRRLAVFAQRLAGHDVVLTTNFFDARQALLTSPTPFDIAYLDHDLGPGSITQLPDGRLVELNGSSVADFMVNELPKIQRPRRVVIHSWNPPGAMAMRTIFASAGIPASLEVFRA